MKEGEKGKEEFDPAFFFVEFNGYFDWKLLRVEEARLWL